MKRLFDKGSFCIDVCLTGMISVHLLCFLDKMWLNFISGAVEGIFTLGASFLALCRSASYLERARKQLKSSSKAAKKVRS